MISVRVTSVGDVTPARLAGMLLDYERETSDLSPAWPRVIAAFQRQERLRFDTENAPGPSGRWAALSPKYAAWKARRYPGRPILTLTGRLRASLESAGAGSEIRQDKRSLFMGSIVPYGIYHQTGEGQRFRRPPIDPSDRDVRDWVAEIWRYFESVKSRVGFKGRLVAAMS